MTECTSDVANVLGNVVRDLTICFAYYENAGMLEYQCRCLRELPDWLKARLRLIVVDDGTGAQKCSADGTPIPGATPSSAQPAQYCDIGFPFEIYRMCFDIPWNQDACRNLAVARAQTKWVLLTDIDHVPLKKTLAKLVSHPLNAKKVYRFVRYIKMPNGRIKLYHVHQNSHLITRDAFWLVGGYDEVLRGRYGTDGDIVKRMNNVLGNYITLPWPLHLITRRMILDASTITYARKIPSSDNGVSDLIARRVTNPQWKPTLFQTPWVRIA
jgi:hypothetical protein